MKTIIIFVTLSVCFVFSNENINATGFEDLLPLRSKSATLNEGGFFIKKMDAKIKKSVYCKNCNNVFIQKHCKQIYCSTKCREFKIKEYFEDKKKITDFRIFERDDFTCIYCGKTSIKDGIKLRLEHIYPRKRGGKNDLFNIVTACNECNGSKSSKMLKEEIMLIIMKRNYDLNSRFDEVTYNELINVFNKRYKLNI